MLTMAKNGQTTVFKVLALTLTLVAFFSLSSAAFAGNVSAGFFYDEFPLTIGSGQRTEILGPLYYNLNSETNQTWAFPPFLSREADPTINQGEYDFLYPLFTWTHYDTQYRAQFFQLFSFAGGDNPDDPEKRFTLFPIYFQQRGPDPEKNYTAVFPFYGHINNRLFRDKIYFVMFPAYGQTWKKDLINYNYLYPFFNWRYANGLYGWQFWPFYGHEHKDVTVVTNTWGNETVGGHDQYFALWPIYFWQNNEINTENPEKVRAYLPFYELYRSPLRDTTSYFWPFFTIIDDRGRKYHEWEVPWPFFVFARGEGKTMNCVFPFYSRAHNDVYTDNFYAWPVVKYNAIYSPPLDLHRTRIVFFLFQNTVENDTARHLQEQRLDLWPFFVYHRYFDGSTHLQILALIETFFPDNRGVRRNWSPLWSVWRSENNPKMGADSQSFLWNFYRRDAAPNAKKISFFFGLYQYQSEMDTQKWRLFYIPVHQAPRRPQ